MLINLDFHGRLRKQFSPRYTFEAKSPAEAMYRFFRLVAGAEKFFRDTQGTLYHFRVNGKEVADPQTLHLPNGGTLDVYPVVEGSKKGGVLQTIIGIVVVIICVIVFKYPGAVGGLSAGGGVAGNAGGTVLGLGAKSWTMVASFGVAMAAGGLAQMLAKTTTLGEDTTHKTSDVFSHLGQLANQGEAVPVGYGEWHVSPLTISFNLTQEEESNWVYGDGNDYSSVKATLGGPVDIAYLWAIPPSEGANDVLTYDGKYNLSYGMLSARGMLRTVRVFVFNSADYAL